MTEIIIYTEIALATLIIVLGTLGIRTWLRIRVMLDQASRDTASVAEEVKQISSEIVDVNRRLEEARIQENTCPKDRRKTDKKISN